MYKNTWRTPSKLPVRKFLHRLTQFLYQVFLQYEFNSLSVDVWKG